MVGTKRSIPPFFIQAGLVILNRTSGSTSPDNTDTISATVTVTATATVSASNSSLVYTAPLDLSRSKDAAIGAGVADLPGFGVFVALGPLWL